MTDDDRKAIGEEFAAAVNMAPATLESWLDSEESKSVGYSDGRNKSDAGGKESVGHASGRRIVEIKRKKKSELTDDDVAHMKKVVGYIHRHLAQRPDGDVSESRWRYSLMNWGHDPEA